MAEAPNRVDVGIDFIGMLVSPYLNTLTDRHYSIKQPGNNLDDEIVFGYSMYIGKLDVLALALASLDDVNTDGDPLLTAAVTTNIQVRTSCYISIESGAIIYVKGTSPLTSIVRNLFPPPVILASMWPNNFFRHASFISNRLGFFGTNLHPGLVIFSGNYNEPFNPFRGTNRLDQQLEPIIRPDLGAFGFTPLFLDANYYYSQSNDIAPLVNTNAGFFELFRFAEGEITIKWSTIISFTLWIGTDIGALALTEISPAKIRELNVSPERSAESDQGSQTESAPIPIDRVLLQKSDSGDFVFIIQDSEELKRKITESVTTKIELDAFQDDNIKSVHSTPFLGFVIILTKGGKVFFGTVKKEIIAFCEWEFSSSVNNAAIVGSNAYFHLKGNKIVKVNLVKQTEIEADVPLTFETHSPECYLLNYVLSEADQDPLHSLGGGRAVLKDGQLYGRFQCEEIGIGSSDIGVIDVVKSDELGLTFDDDGNVTETAKGMKNGTALSFSSVQTDNRFSGVVFDFKGRKRKVDLSVMFVHIPR